MFTDQSGTQPFHNYTLLSGFPQLTIRSGGDLAPANLTWGNSHSATRRRLRSAVIAMASL